MNADNMSSYEIGEHKRLIKAGREHLQELARYDYAVGLYYDAIARNNGVFEGVRFTYTPG